MLYREGKGRYNPNEMCAGFMIEVDPIQGELFQLNQKGLTIGLFTDVNKSVDQLSNFKTNSALAYVLASIHKTKEGWDDCLLLNTRSNICDSTNSNVFLVKEKILSTPSLDEGCINGVMRRQVMALAEANGFTVKESAIEIEMLRQADEIFLTNAVNGIRWVKQFGNHEYENKISSRLSAALRKLVS
jgi:branched-chain amino acid aminotransferase